MTLLAIVLKSSRIRKSTGIYENSWILRLQHVVTRKNRSRHFLVFTNELLRDEVAWNFTIRTFLAQKIEVLSKKSDRVKFLVRSSDAIFSIARGKGSSRRVYALLYRRMKIVRAVISHSGTFPAGMVICHLPSGRVRFFPRLSFQPSEEKSSRPLVTCRKRRSCYP